MFPRFMLLFIIGINRVWDDCGTTKKLWTGTKTGTDCRLPTVDWDEVAFEPTRPAEQTVTNMAAVVKSPNDPREYR